MVPSWHNWAGNQIAHPLGIEHPSTEDERSDRQASR